MSDFQLARPPVAEAWIGFKFDPGQRKMPWNLKTAQEFFVHFKDTFKQLEAGGQQTFTIQPVTAGETAELKIESKLVVLRGRNEAGTRWLQLAEDTLVFHITEPGEAYPGFPQLLNETKEAFTKYVEHFEPQGLRQAAVHYVDIIEIPFAVDKEIRLDDYFVLLRDAPTETFGYTNYLETRMIFVRPEDPGPIEMTLQRIPAPPDPACLRLRMDWHKNCDEVGVLDWPSIEGRLQTARQVLFSCFKNSLTERTWQLFTETKEKTPCHSQ